MEQLQREIEDLRRRRDELLPDGALPNASSTGALVRLPNVSKLSNCHAAVCHAAYLARCRTSWTNCQRQHERAAIICHLPCRPSAPSLPNCAHPLPSCANPPAHNKPDRTHAAVAHHWSVMFPICCRLFLMDPCHVFANKLRALVKHARPRNGAGKHWQSAAGLCLLPTCTYC